MNDYEARKRRDEARQRLYEARRLRTAILDAIGRQDISQVKAGWLCARKNYATDDAMAARYHDEYERLRGVIHGQRIDIKRLVDELLDLTAGESS